jgi:pyrroline-5-carboxylate reductase
MIQDSRFKIQDIFVSEQREERRRYLEQAYGIRTTPFNRETALSCRIIILAVKPQNMDAVLGEMSDLITDENTVVSIAAGITLSYLQSRLRTKKLIRVMPNTPALVQKGMSVMSLCECFDDKDICAVREVFMSIGNVLTLPEKQMNAVTALSGSGPAFLAFFVEAMTEAGVSAGLSRGDASELAVQTFIGTAGLLETGMPPQKLREMVTSPGGTTAAGLKVLDEKGLNDLVRETISAAVRRAEELGRRD